MISELFDLGWHLKVKLGNMEAWMTFKGQIGKYGSDFEQYLNIFTFGELFTWTGTNNDFTYDFLSATQAILSNVRTDFNLTKFLFW